MSRKIGEIRRRTSRKWWATGATLVAVAVFSVVFAAASGGTVLGSTFEGNDGNMLVGGNPTPPGNGTEDWANVPATTIPDASGKTDDTIGSSKEDDPFPQIVTQSAPPKDDFTSVSLATEVIGTNVYLYQSSIRSAPNGSANENVELNQSTTLSANNLTPVRTPGDKLITFDFGGGTANITILNWNTTNATPCADANDSQPCWDTQTSLNSTLAEGAVNDGLNGRTGAIAAADNPLTSQDLVVNQFQEMAVNLTGTGILPSASSGDCESFASATIKSRSSGATGTFNSDLKDIVFAKKAITNCGTIIVKKHMVGGTDSFGFTGDPNGTISTDGGTISETVPPNVQYVSTEAAKAGWALTDVSCDKAHGAGDKVARTATFNPAPGETITCTFTNTKLGSIIVKKVTNPSPDTTDSFTFTGDAAGSIKNGETITSSSLLPGTYTSTEAAAAGFDLTSISCDDANSATASSGDTTTRQATFKLDAGETVTCTFTNTKRATITVKKVTDPSGDPATFGFSGDITATLGDGQSADASVAPGTYHVTEAAKTGWDLTNISCDNGGSSGDKATGISTFVVTAGQHVTCTYTNTKRATITVKKVTDPSGDPATFGFSGDITATLGDGQSADQSVVPGTYHVTETAKTGWDLTNISCDAAGSTGNKATGVAEFVVTAGQHVTCTYTNTKRATITVKKVTDPSGDPATFGFSGDITATLGDGQSADASVAPGTYHVTEAAKTGWDLTNISCDNGGSSGVKATGVATFVVTAGQHVTCTYTNTKRATITVKKLTDPSGDPATFSFTGDITATLGDGQSADASVAPGTYHVTEGAKTGWNLVSISCDAAGSSGVTGTGVATYVVTAGQHVTCTYTNTKQATITVKKVTDPSGDPATFSFTGDVTATLGDGQSASSPVAPGTYHVTEAAKTGWNLTNISCDDAGSSGDKATGISTFVVTAGQHVTCTYTNTKRATITVKKVTDPSGDPATFGFTGDITATLGDGQSADQSVAPGTYHVTEAAKTGWDLTNISCDNGGSSGDKATGISTFVVAAGQHVTCTYTNTKRATITVKKVTDPSGDPATFGFSGDITATLGDGQSADQSVAPGTYHVTEAAKTGWDLTNISCDNGGSSGDRATGVSTFVVTAGQHVTCTYTNTKRATITVKKLTDPSGDPATFSFTGDITATLGDDQSADASVAPGTYHVTETAKTGWDLTNISCDDAGSSGVKATGVSTFVVTAGQHVTCTYTNTKQASITVKKVTDPSGVDQAFSFTGDITASLSDGQSSGHAVSPGTYHVTEGSTTGWALTDISCDDAGSTGDTATGVATFVVTAGQQVTCTYTNSRLPQVKVVKQLVPSNDPGTFDFAIGEQSFTNGGDGYGDGGNTGFVSVQPGTTTISESGNGNTDLTNYDSSVSCTNDASANDVSLDLNLAYGDQVTCTFTNVRRATIEIVKQTLGAGGTFDFTLNDPQLEASFPFQLSPASSGATDTADFSVPPGDFTVVEAAKDGWALTGLSCSVGEGSSDNGSQDQSNPNQANIHVTAGGFVQCTYTNTKLATLIVVKQVDNSNGGGSKGPGDFTIHATAAGLELPGSPAAGSSTGTTYSGLMPGTYKVSEDAVSGYSL
jgi:hypothetical protein